MPTLMTKKDVKNKYKHLLPKPYKTDTKRIHAYYYAIPLWNKLSKAYRMTHPLCELCQTNNKLTLAQDTHHIVSFMEGQDNNHKLKLLLDSDNLMSLCKYCHGSIHGNINNLTDKQQEYLQYKEKQIRIKHTLI